MTLENTKKIIEELNGYALPIKREFYIKGRLDVINEEIIFINNNIVLNPLRCMECGANSINKLGRLKELTQEKEYLEGVTNGI